MGRIHCNSTMRVRRWQQDATSFADSLFLLVAFGSSFLACSRKFACVFALTLVCWDVDALLDYLVCV